MAGNSGVTQRLGESETSFVLVRTKLVAPALRGQMLSGLAAGVLAAALVALAPSSGGVWALIGASAPLGLTAVRRPR
jgi:hypothetical protein